MPARNGRGVCRACRRSFDLTKAGYVRHHLKPKQPGQWYRPPVCDGAGEPPSHRPTEETR